MTATPKNAGKANPTDRPIETYRGVRLPPIVGPSRFSSEQIERAVETAIAKHAHDLARDS
jgi:hypothetical protein